MSLFSFLFGNKNAKLLSPQEYKSHIQNKKVQLIDVRTPNEFQQGHIKKAKNIDVFSKDFISKIEKLNKDQAVYVYCRSGGRSRLASKKLARKGFLEIYDLKGGYLKW